MGFSESFITIQNPQREFKDETILAALGFNLVEYTGEVNVNDRAFNEGVIDIGFLNNCIVIRDHFMFLDNNTIAGTPELSDLSQIEKDLAPLYPTSEILSVFCVSSVNGHYYSLVRDQQKVRVKTANDEEPVSGFGERIEEEIEIYKDAKLKDGEWIWEDEYAESELMEDFAFGILARHLGVRYDRSDFPDDMIFKRYQVNTKYGKSREIDLQQVSRSPEYNKQVDAIRPIFHEYYLYNYFELGLDEKQIESKFLGKGFRKNIIDHSERKTRKFVIEKQKKNINNSINKKTTMGVGVVILVLGLGFCAPANDFAAFGIPMGIVGLLVILVGYLGYRRVMSEVFEFDKPLVDNEKVLMGTINKNKEVYPAFIGGQSQANTESVQDEMNDNDFWKIIETARSGGTEIKEQYSECLLQLMDLDNETVAKFRNAYTKYEYAYYTSKHYLAYSIARGFWVQDYAEKSSSFVFLGREKVQQLIADPMLIIELIDWMFIHSFYELENPGSRILNHRKVSNHATDIWHDAAADALGDIIYHDDDNVRIDLLRKHYPEYASKYPRSNLMTVGSDY